jgi:hypothetical protein
LPTFALHCDKTSWFGHIEAAPASIYCFGFNDFERQWFERGGGCRPEMVPAAQKRQRSGDFGRMSVDRPKRAMAWGVLILSAIALGGCAISIADLPLGTSSDAQAQSKDGNYLPVNALPPDRDEAAMAPAERAKIQNELIAARERQASAAVAKDSAAK